MTPTEYRMKLGEPGNGHESVLFNLYVDLFTTLGTQCEAFGAGDREIAAYMAEGESALRTAIKAVEESTQ